MKKGVIFCLFTALISGASIFINKFGVKGIDSTVFAFSKNLLVGLLLFGIILGFNEIKNLKKLSKKDWMSLVLIGLVGGSIPFVLFFKGLQMGTGAMGAFIHKTMFIFVAILAMIFLREKLSKRILIPAVLLLAGNFMLLKLSSIEFSTGAVLIFIATLFWSVENVISKKVLSRVEPKVLAFGRLFFGSLFILIYMTFTSKISLVFNLGGAQLGWIAVSSVFLLLYVITWYSGLQQIKATTATSILLLGSPITTILSLVFLGSAVSLMQSIGIMLVLVGVIAMITLSDRKSNLSVVRT